MAEERKGARINRHNENHHSVPKFYLEHWCSADGRMWIYPMDGRSPFRAGPKSFAGENGLYDTSDIQDLIPDKDRDDEGLLSGLEGLFASRWPEVFKSIANPQTKRNIACYLALQHARMPERMNDVRSVNKFYRDTVASLPPTATAFELVHKSGERIRMNVADVRELAQDSPRHIKAGFINTLRHSVLDLADILAARKWAVIVSDVPAFLTSDSPLVLSRGSAESEQFGFGTPGTIITFPISPTMMLRIDDSLEHDGLHYPLINVGDINDGTILRATRFVFSLIPLPDRDPGEVSL